MAWRIAGEYLDENGDPIAGAQVIANVRSTGAVAGLATTDVDGLFQMALDAGDPIYVSVFQDGFAPRIFDQIEPEEFFDFFALLLESGDNLLTEGGDSLALE